MSIDSEEDLRGLREAGRVVSLTLRAMRDALRAGMTTAEVDAIGREALERHGAHSAPEMVYGFPGANCISVNDEAVHGIPGVRCIEPGDLIKLDVTAELGGYMADAAITVAVPPATPESEGLARCAELAMWKGIRAARAGRPISTIGRAVERCVEEEGFFVLRELAGHGIGRTIHEPPSVPNFETHRARAPLTDGLVITIEPIISAGSRWTRTSNDGWTVRTRDGSRAAHFEHTLVVTRDKPLVLTA
jgi:methionyl aminopeptidase